MEFSLPEEIWIEDSVYGTPLAQRIRDHAEGVICKIVPSGERELFANADATLSPGRRILFLDHLGGPFLHSCSKREECASCSVRTVTLYQDCLSNGPGNGVAPPLTLHANLNDLATELECFAGDSSGCLLRVNTGLYSDSLELEPLTGYAADLVQIFGRFPKVSLELRTRLDHVESLIGLDPGKTVVNWSVNPQELLQHEERFATPLASRIEAAVRVAAAGYRVGFTFDPMVHYSGWQERYYDTMDMIAAALSPDKVASFYLGTLRFPPAQKQSVQRRIPHNGNFDSEFVISADARMRYFLPIRVEMYRFMVEQIRHHFPNAGIYLCMEPSEVWQRVLGSVQSNPAEALRRTG